jgi:hypothetical protein
LFWCGEKDLNLRSPKAPDLQSSAIDHSAIAACQNIIQQKRYFSKSGNGVFHDRIILEMKIEEKVLESNCLFFGDREVLFPIVKKAASDIYKDINIFEIEKLNISVYDVRQAIDFVNKTSESKKIVMLSSFYWLTGAQNAMLKVLEETPPNTFFYIFGFSEKYFLDTVLSRVGKVNYRNSNRYLETAKKVLELEPNERLESKEVKKILAQKTTDYNFEKDTENEKKDREAHILFLFALLDTVLANKEKLNLQKDFLEKILKISTLAETDGASPHLFVEWLILSVPKL